MRRNRQERRGATTYRLEPLFEAADRKPVLEAGPEHYLEGELGNCLIVSVPPTTSFESCRGLRAKLRQTVGCPDKPILILTHNIEFLRAHRLPASEASKVTGRIDDSVHGGSGTSIPPRSEDEAS